MAKRNVLGKGLGALIRETEPEGGDRLRRLNIEEIVPNPYQPRKKFDENELNKLAANINEKGLLVPLLVHKQKDNYELIAGERRWRAAQIAGLKQVPALIHEEITALGSMEISLIENIHRQDLNPMEEAAAYRVLNEEFGLVQEEVAKLVGKDRVTVANSLRLLKLPEDVQEIVSRGRITAGHARALLPLEDAAAIRSVAKKIIDQELSVRSTESLVKRIIKDKGKKQNKLKADPQIRVLQDALTRTFGTKVKIKTTGKKGAIEIHFFSPEDLQRIIDLLVGPVD